MCSFVQVTPRACLPDPRGMALYRYRGFSAGHQAGTPAAWSALGRKDQTEAKSEGAPWEEGTKTWRETESPLVSDPAPEGGRERQRAGGEKPAARGGCPGSSRLLGRAVLVRA